MPVQPTYAIDKEPCVPVRLTGGRQESLGLRDVLIRAHEIEDLALPLPPAVSTLLRLLVAVTARITALDDPDMATGEWTAHRRRLLQQPSGFDPSAVHRYFDRYVWDLFDTARPFLQDPRLAGQCQERAGVNKLVFGRPAGNNLAWLSPHHDTHPEPVPCDQALWHLLVHHSYGASGTCSARTAGDVSSGNGTAGPLRSTISFHPLGRTLYETLLAGLPQPADDWPETADRCPWEEPELPDPTAPLPPVTWPGRLLTGRSRHAILLVPDHDGRHVIDAYLTWATQHPKLQARDPYLIHHFDPDKPVSQRLTPRKADADRALWRDLDALLLAGDETSAVQRPAVFSTVNDLPGDLRARLRVRVCGFDQDGKTNNRIWYTALTPPIWPWVQENDPSVAKRIAECRIAADDTGSRLFKVSKEAWHETAFPPRDTAGGKKMPRHMPAWTLRTSAQYWPRAEATFWRLIDQPSQPAPAAFAADAITALREVTRPAIAQHFRAARAVARAVATLRRASQRHTTP
ncbi:type I-E CRISPR-associated protein Cse1/CasA [Streptomyces sp900116325]|uniref:type I-E CRISPR-associated protein Cse1/CasA n=1 Tax=Streptomyces sp. 900116325 TaxID=3154295 RepID=UPI00332A09CA